MKKPIIGIFGSSQVKQGSIGWEEAYSCGRLVAKAGMRVLNGGYRGIMEASAQGAQEEGGETIGVTTDEFPKSVKNPFITYEERQGRWHERLFHLMNRADGFIVLEGGTGTLVELACLLEMTNKQFIAKPVVILGEKMRSLVSFIRVLPEMKISASIHLSVAPTDAVQYLQEKVKAAA